MITSMRLTGGRLRPTFLDLHSMAWLLLGSLELRTTSTTVDAEKNGMELYAVLFVAPIVYQTAINSSRGD